MRDEIHPDKGGGRPSPQAVRELLELDDPAHPRTMLSPSVELEVNDERLRLADDDLNRTGFDPTVHPKPPDGTTEATTDRTGSFEVDLQRDTPDVGVEIGSTDRDIFRFGLEEFDDLTTGLDDLGDVDPLGDL